MTTNPFARGSRTALAVGRWIGALGVAIGASAVQAQTPLTTCDATGIGATVLHADGPQVTILSATPATAGSGASAVPYCLVKVLVPQAINIWVGLPMEGKWNGRWQSLGGGGYAGSV